MKALIFPPRISYYLYFPSFLFAKNATGRFPLTSQLKWYNTVWNEFQIARMNTNYCFKRGRGHENLLKKVHLINGIGLTMLNSFSFPLSLLCVHVIHLLSFSLWSNLSALFSLSLSAHTPQSIVPKHRVLALPSGHNNYCPKKSHRPTSTCTRVNFHGNEPEKKLSGQTSPRPYVKIEKTIETHLCVLILQKCFCN